MATQDLATLVVKLEAQTAQYIDGLDKANKRLAKFNTDQNSLLKSIGEGIAGAVAAADVAFEEMVRHTIEADDHLNKLAQSTGISVESLSQLKYAAELSNISVDDFAKGMKGLSVAAEEAATNGASKAAKAFQQLGVQFKNSDGSLKDTDKLFTDVAQAMSGFKDGAGKAAVAQTLFSKVGAEFIPLLNQGAEGLAKLRDEADKFGVTVSSGTAAAAEELNDNFTRLKAAGQGLVNQFVAKFLPTFSEMTASFIEAAKQGGALDFAFQALAFTFKVIVSAAIIVTSVFQQLGKLVYSVAAAIVRVAHGDFKLAADELKDGWQSAKTNVTDDMEKIAQIWSGQAPKMDQASTSINDSTKKAFKFVDEEAQKKIDEAVKKLKEFSAGLAEQIATFKLGNAAATEYNVTHGKLAMTVTAAGKAGKALRTEIIAEADALEKLNNIDAVKQLDIQIQTLTGHTVEAATAAFDLQNQQLKASLVRQNDSGGLKQLETLKQLTIAQAQYNELEKQATQIREDLAATEDRIQHSQEVGAINELQALAQLDDARKKAVDRLSEILGKEKEIANNSGNEALQKSAKQSQEQLTKLAEQTNLFNQKIRASIEDVAGDEFGSFLTGAESASKAMKNFLAQTEADILKFIAKDAIRRFTNFLFGAAGGGTGSGGGGGGLLASAGGLISSLFGGSRDSGGRGKPGSAYYIGTGAQPEMFVPDSPGTFVPAGGYGGGGNTTQNIYVQGRMDARSARQVQIEAARRQRIASSRLG